ncbi:AsmA family protein [Lignipirellula cremea]|uniref:AsmA-like C-terminal domain-containing protein n=1 Tax=Lignipirellula cremea TaxID=2528010 RepID=A0A518DYJ1_9BACT|nr:hypothetical protein [Lignipirellula cremea]QDU96909.1 hypothetical protein Pla8534_47310 [Lignipirellula cremea]
MAKKKRSKATLAGRGNRLAGGVLLLAILAIGWAPTIVAKTSLREQLVGWAIPGFEGKASMDSASLGWVTSAEFRGVKFVDKEGNPLLEAERVACDRSLWQLIGNRQNLGVLTIEKPHLHCQLRADGSNLEDAFASLLAGDDSDSPLPGFQIALTDGVIELLDTTTNDAWRFEKVTAGLDMPLEAETIEGRLAGSAQRGEEPPGDLDCTLTWNPDPEGFGAGEAKLKTNQLPLAAAEGLLRRVGYRVAPAGRLSSELSYQWEENGAEQALHIEQLNGQAIRIAAPDWWGPTPVQTAALDLRGALQWSQGRLDASNLVLDSSLGHVEASGSTRLGAFTTEDLVRALQQDNFGLKGRLNIAEVAAAAPQLLRMRNDLQLTSGEVDFTLSSQDDAQQVRRWEASLHTSQLTALQAGQTVTWDKPIHLTAIARQTEQGPTIEKLDCTSSFLTATGEGTLAGGQIRMNCSLDQLANELRQFIDLTGVNLGGTVDMDASWRREADGRIAVNAAGKALRLAVAAPGVRPWNEDELSLTLAATGQATLAAVTRVDTAALRIQSASDALVVTLLEPIASPQADSSALVRCELGGELSRWADRAQSFVDLAGWDVRGNVNGSTEARLTLSRGDFAKGTLTVDGLHLAGGGMTIDEPRVEATGQGSWDTRSGSLSLLKATLASSALSLGASDIQVESAPGLPGLAGKVAYRADIARVSNWFLAGAAAPTYRAYGSATGEVQLSQRDGITTADCRNHLEQVVLMSRTVPAPGVVTPVSAAAGWMTVWQEPQVNASCQAQYHHEGDSLQIVRCDLAAELLSLAAAGRVTQLTASPQAELAGKINYDLARVATKLKPLMGLDFDLQGEGVRDFSLRGPLLPEASTPGSGAPGENALGQLVHDDLQATFGLGWTSAAIEGMIFGPGELTARLEKGTVYVAPLDVAVSEGRLRAAPQIQLNASPTMLVLGQTALLEKVRLSPAMCRHWLKYVAPLLADSTVAEGRFSVNLQGAALPVANLVAGSCQGQLLVHSAQVGPGPLAQQLMGSANQLIAVAKQQTFPGRSTGTSSRQLTLAEQTINFQLAQGRVYHENLVMQFDDVQIRTKGSVGFDQTLSLVAQIPVADNWLGNSPLAQSLRGKSIELPVQGTLKQPSLDSRSLTNLGKQMLQGTTNQLLEEGVNRGLQQLFGPRN